MLEQKPTRNQPRSPTSHDAISRQTCNNLGLHRCRHKSFQLCCHQNPGPIPEISQHAIHTFYRMKKCKKESSFVNFMCSSARYSIPLWGSGGMSAWEERRNTVANVAQYHVRVSLELCWVHIWQSMRRMQHCQHEAARKS
jgi:hypothetical protein